MFFKTTSSLINGVFLREKVEVLGLVLNPESQAWMQRISWVVTLKGLILKAYKKLSPLRPANNFFLLKLNLTFDFERRQFDEEKAGSPYLFDSNQYRG